MSYTNTIRRTSKAKKSAVCTIKNVSRKRQNEPVWVEEEAKPGTYSIDAVARSYFNVGDGP